MSNNKYSLRKRFKYWLDNQMSKGTMSMIMLLAIFTIIAITVLSILLTLLDAASRIESTSIFWNVFSNTINSEVPTYDEGGLAYLIVLTLCAFVGLLFTSLLISILANGVETRVMKLKEGTSHVIEKNHIVVLGYSEGSFELLKQLCMEYEDEKTCIVIADKLEKESVEREIKANIKVPEKIHIVFRNLDICDAAMLEYLAIEDSSSILINEQDDTKTIRCILAVNRYLKDYPDSKTNLETYILHKENAHVAEIAMQQKGEVLDVSRFVSRVIAHSSTQPGISNAYRELLSFEGSEFYFKHYPEFTGMTFLQISMSLPHCTPIGVADGDEVILSPEPSLVLKPTQDLILLAENLSKCESEIVDDSNDIVEVKDFHAKAHRNRILIIGYNDRIFKTTVNELNDSGSTIIVSGITDEDEQKIKDNELFSSTVTINREDDLDELVEDVDHVILLADESIDDEESDQHIIELLLELYDIRKQKQITFNITAEMKNESNKRLISYVHPADYIIASDISAMLLAQCYRDKHMVPVFHEILSNDGNEINLIKASDIIDCSRSYQSKELRKILMGYHSSFFGYIKNEEGILNTHLNPDSDENIALNDIDQIIIMNKHS